MPMVAKKLAETGNYDGIICAALVVNGGIYRHEFVAQAVLDGIVRAGMETGVPVYSVSLTPMNFKKLQNISNSILSIFQKKVLKLLMRF